MRSASNFRWRQHRSRKATPIRISDGIPTPPGVIVFPLMLLYTLTSYSVFKGKVGTAAAHD
jgi:hypothetical protein